MKCNLYGYSTENITNKNLVARVAVNNNSSKYDLIVIIFQGIVTFSAFFYW